MRHYYCDLNVKFTLNSSILSILTKGGQNNDFKIAVQIVTEVLSV